MSHLQFDTRRSVGNMVQNQYHASWKKYDAWQRIYAANLIFGLRRGTKGKRSNPRKPHVILPSSPLALDAIARTRSGLQYASFLTIDDSTFGIDAAHPSRHFEPSKLEHATPLILHWASKEGVPTFLAYTPIKRSIHVGEDDYRMPFVPLADDPTFDAYSTIEQYDSLRWQDDPGLPSRKCVVGPLCRFSLPFWRYIYRGYYRA